MEAFVDSPSKTHKATLGISLISPSTSVISSSGRPQAMKQSRMEGASAGYHASAKTNGIMSVRQKNGSVTNPNHSHNVGHDLIPPEEFPSVAKQFYGSSGRESELVSSSESLTKSSETSPEKKVFMMEAKSSIELPTEDPMSSTSSGSLESESTISGPSKGDVGVLLNNHITSQTGLGGFCPSPSASVYTATLYAEAKQSFTHTEVSEGAGTIEKSGESGEVTNTYDSESRKSSMYRGSTGSDVSDESSSSSLSNTWYKPHKANDIRWEAIQVVRSRYGPLGLGHFRLLSQLGCGDIGKVHLAELTGTRTAFAMKVMDKAVLAARKKLLRAQTEREILQSLDHPFLPTLYAHFESEKFSCLVMEFCPGGDLHALRQRQPGKYFPEHAARFYVGEVLLAMEYLHMLGIIYRDLKPENVLVREDGHIMLSDFDLSLRCAVSPTLVRSSNPIVESKNSGYCVQPSCIKPTCVIQPDCIQPACFGPRFFKSKKDKKSKSKPKNETSHQVSPLPEFMAEPTGARSMSFVGTHEYLAPEIVKGEGHGSAVDWWTLGIFLYELLFGKTPFKGAGNRATLFNVVGQPLRFPESPPVSFAARDLIRGLLVKEPQNRLAYRRGATEIKQHPFFQSINWALIRCTTPPDVPKQAVMEHLMRSDVRKAPSSTTTTTTGGNAAGGVDVKPTGNYFEMDFF